MVEKALKALHLHHAQQTWGHGLGRSFRDLPPAVAQNLDAEVADLKDRLRILDALYIPTRYPDSLPEGAPTDQFGRLQSQDALCHARALVDAICAALAPSTCVCSIGPWNACPSAAMPWCSRRPNYRPCLPVARAWVPSFCQVGRGGSSRLTSTARSRRATAHRDGDFMRLLNLPFAKLPLLRDKA
ncbi:MAG: HEPN domain-containing protein [Cyanobium sp. LacPavin_0920_WC12_MAG_63_22]|nr:HEPN domain-containing protein [Cyanobium sp. LacPavin_0920_WC12_MAG_63_22]